MSDDDGGIYLGHLGRAHGMDGEIRLFIEDFSDGTLYEGLAVEVGGDYGVERFEIASVRWSNDFAIVRFCGIEDRTGAEQLTNLDVHTSLDQLPELGEDEFYRARLAGADVRLLDSDGRTRRIGEVLGFFDAGGANDVMTVALEAGGEYNVPMIDRAIASIDPEAQEVILEPLQNWAPEGTELL